MCKCAGYLCMHTGGPSYESVCIDMSPPKNTISRDREIDTVPEPESVACDGVTVRTPSAPPSTFKIRARAAVISRTLMQEDQSARSLACTFTVQSPKGVKDAKDAECQMVRGEHCATLVHRLKFGVHFNCPTTKAMSSVHEHDGEHRWRTSAYHRIAEGVRACAGVSGVVCTALHTTLRLLFLLRSTQTDPR